SAVSARANRTEQAFAWCTLAEMAIRHGDRATAEVRFKRSLELEPGDAYTLTAYCDMLLEMGRRSEVVTRIELDAVSEALLTRRFLASKATREEVKPFVEQLTASGHFRELAMLQLNILKMPELALESALANWRKQKEPIDSILVLRAAVASG